MNRVYPLHSIGFGVSLLLCGQFAYAHGEVETQIGTQVSAAVSATWRDDGMLLQDGRWQIPGVLMGGEAYPVEEGTTVDEARISVQHRTADGVFGMLQVSSHDGVSDAEIHHAYGGVEFDTGPMFITVSAGRMAAAMTPANGEHSSDRLFSETPLPMDAFLGRQLNDDGVRLTLSAGPFQLGLESWQGDGFPANGAGDESGDVYLHYLERWHALALHAGMWWLQADAEDRADTRYTASGHSHGSITSDAPEYWFDGRTEISGVFIRLNGDFSRNWQWSVEAQYFQVDIDGVIWDNTRQVQWIADNNGGWLQASVGYGDHQVGVRWERLALANNITGAAAHNMAELTGLYNLKHDPERTGLLYRWQLRPDFALRFEAIEDAIQSDSVQRFALGMIWSVDLIAL